MTNPGLSRVIQDGARTSTSLKILGRIAEVLDIPVTELYRHDAETCEESVPSAAECERMLAAFLHVQDPDVRDRIVDMMRAYSDN